MPIIPIHPAFSEVKFPQILTLLSSLKFTRNQRRSSALLTALLKTFFEKIAKQKSCPKIHRPNSKFLPVFAGHARGQQKVDQELSVLS
jgi:hypothetical protein